MNNTIKLFKSLCFYRVKEYAHRFLPRTTKIKHAKKRLINKTI